MTKIWINKTKSFEEAKTFDKEYYKNMSAADRIETIQILREQYFKLKYPNLNKNGRRLQRVCKIIKQA